MDARKAPESQVSTGIAHLDRLLGHLSPGDNVVWYDLAGSLAWPFSFRFLQASHAEERPLLYVTFDSAPRDLLSHLGPLAHNPHLTILDCFTWGKGKGSDAFLSFYYEDRLGYPGRIVRVDEPSQISLVKETLWGTYASLEGDVRFVFESLTGMQELWRDPEAVLDFYRQTCPRLYELDTVSYWIFKGDGPAPAMRAQLNTIAQIAIDLAVRRGKTFLTAVKTGNRGKGHLNGPHKYWIEDDHSVTFEDHNVPAIQIELWRRLKEARKARGISQSELARLVGVTGSTISQIESNVVFPSLPTLLKIAEALSVEPSFFLQSTSDAREQLVFSPSQGKEIALPHMQEGSVRVHAVTPLGSAYRADIYVIEIPPRCKLGSHFLMHKGDEIGCVLTGKLQFSLNEKIHKLNPGDVVYLTCHVPDHWENSGSAVAKLLWIKMKEDA